MSIKLEKKISQGYYKNLYANVYEILDKKYSEQYFKIDKGIKSSYHKTNTNYA